MENFLYIHLSMTIIFSILLVVLGNEKSFSPLNSTYIKLAKERFMSLDPTKLPDPPMPSYTFVIYHRDVFEKSKFKGYDSLIEKRLARCHARANSLASIFEIGNRTARGSKISHEKVPKSTSTHYANGEYVASFMLGSQEVKNYLLVDTGSDLVWWQCGPCEPNKCYEQKLQPLYVPTNSKVFRKIDCFLHSERCLDDLDLNYKCTSDHSCTYDVKYASGERSKGYMADDVITFVLDQRPVRIIFGCGQDQTNGTAFSGEFSGVVGLGRRKIIGGYSLPTQFGADLMSMCLPPYYSAKESTLSFHKTIFPRATSAKLILNLKYPSFYFVDLYKVFINDKEVQLSPSWWNFRKDLTGGVLLDTGTFISRFPQEFYTLFRYVFREEVRDIPLVDTPAEPFDTCYKADPSREVNFPVVKLYFGSVSPSTMLLLVNERVVVHFNGQYCMAFLPWERPFAILGSNQLQGVGLTFDTSANTVSFDIDACIKL
ncbi:PREDICTED: protein ASPARTIC PROTEASE IN GUARD CELL 1-like [Nicotiana attenuata]|uniref:protein ASPARTIC PROTEASE IN GUARD CELL 1-like n=1 Tax=Nicotiana attenuata TaxID=49451 RepID=UPI000904F319|nr:PREDICTED: protein ASPARTIC PROTEASE IN GUARD CELL 1-like [Nicotiana attenuata]